MLVRDCDTELMASYGTKVSVNLGHKSICLFQGSRDDSELN